MIRTTLQLQRLCARLHQLKFMTIDTEFMREETFYPKLCLIQIGGGKGAWVIDALAPNLDLTALFDVLLDKAVIKVFHACRQDLEIFYHLMHKMPTPVFDTQVGAMVCGYGENVGYQQLVRDYLKIELDKGMRVTDWSHRPLTKDQEEYALHDVMELKQVYTKMMDDICTANRLDWVQEEMQSLLDPLLYEPDAGRLLEKMRLPFHDPVKVHLCARLCEWREGWAKKLNVPRSFIASDTALMECAALRPQDPQQLKNLRLLGGKLSRQEIADSLCTYWGKILSEPVQKWPCKKRPTLNANKKSQMEALSLLRNIVCLEARVAPHLVASSEDLLAYVTGSEPVRFMQGWRYQIFGRFVDSLMQGKLAFFYDPQKQALTVRSV